MSEKNRNEITQDLESKRLDIREKELEIEKIRLDHKYSLSKQGLMSGSVGVGLAFLIVLALIAGTFADQSIFSGWHIVAIILILVFGLVMYFSLVFWREVKLAAELSENGLKIDAGLGKKS